MSNPNCGETVVKVKYISSCIIKRGMKGMSLPGGRACDGTKKWIGGSRFGHAELCVDFIGIPHSQRSPLDHHPLRKKIIHLRVVLVTVC